MSRNLKADLLLTCCTLVWGATFVVVKDALGDASVFVFLALRFVIAAAVLFAVYRRQLRGLDWRGYGAGALIGCFMFGGYALQTGGLKLTTPSKAAFITGLCVVLVPVFLGIFGARRVRAWVWLGALLALAGLYYLTVPAAENSGGIAAGFSGFTLSGVNRGDWLVLGCTVMFTMHILSIGRYAKRYPAGALALLQIATTALLTCISIPILAATGWEPPRVAWTPQLIAAVALTGVLATAAAFSVQVWAQQYTTSSHTAIIFTAEPVFAAITSFVFYRERLGARALGGAALILVGILLSELKGSAPTTADSAVASQEN